MASVQAWAGPVTRNWSVIVEGKTHCVTLLHNTVTGERSLSVDGEDVLGTAGRSTFLTGPTTLSFTLRGASGTVTITYGGTAVTYRCVYGGADVPEENQVLGGSAALNEDALRMKISVEGYDFGADAKGQPVVLYRLCTVRERDGASTTVHRRFNDFVAVNEALRACYKGSALLGSLPSLPSRSVKLFNLVDHLAPDFINKRQFLLADWLHKVVQVPRARSNPDLLTFLGLIDSVRETSVLFPGPALGLALRGLPGGRGVEVTGLTRTPDGGPSPAQHAGVKPGDRVSKINGEDALSDGFDLLSARVKAAPRPLLVHFLGELPPRADGSGAAAAAAAPVAAAAAAGVVFTATALAAAPPPPSAPPAAAGDPGALGLC